MPNLPTNAKLREAVTVESAVDWDDIETADLTRTNLQRAVMTDVRVFHPERAAAVAPACVEPDVQSRPAPERRSGDREPGLVETK